MTDEVPPAVLLLPNLIIKVNAMKLRSYQLCRWCDSLWHGRRKWITLGAALLVLALILLGIRYLLPFLLLCAALLAVYGLHLRGAFGACYQRPPRPKDALCETVQVDASLIGQGTRLRAAAQPVDPAESLSIRLGSGALLLGAAMTLTADQLDPADRAAILSAVQGLNIKPDRMRSQYPVLAREMQGAVTVLTVRDGMGSRRYYMGPSADVADLCASIWEGHTRPMEDYDHLRVADTAAYIAQGNCRVMAYATALEGETPIFLGLCGLGESIDIAAVQELAALRAMGLTVMVSPGAEEADITSLLALLELPDFHAKADVLLTPRLHPGENALCITRKPGESLQEPLHELRARFRTLEDTLRRLGLYLAIPMGLCLLFGCWGTALSAFALMMYAALFIGVDELAPKPTRAALIGLCLLFLLSRGILLTQIAPLAKIAGGIITMATALCCAIRLSGSRFRPQGWGLALPIAALAYAVIAILLGLSHGTAMLLPLGFSALISAAVGLIMGQR